MGWHKESNLTYKQSYFLNGSLDAQGELKRLQQLKFLYDKNRVLQNSIPKKSVIPKIIHQIWLGPKTPPAVFKESQESIKKLHPDWEYKLWTDEDVLKFWLYNHKYYDNEKNFGAKADILRYEILKRYGGVYLDIDFVLTKPLDWLCQYDFWSVAQPLDCKGHICNGAFGCIPGHSILKDCILLLGENYDTAEDKRILNTTGPMHFQRSVMKFIDEGKMNIIVLPAGFFFPIIFNDRLIGIDALQMKAKQRIQSFLRPETVAIHYWAGSWWEDESSIEKFISS